MPNFLVMRLNCSTDFTHYLWPSEFIQKTWLCWWSKFVNNYCVLLKPINIVLNSITNKIYNPPILHSVGPSDVTDWNSDTWLVNCSCSMLLPGVKDCFLEWTMKQTKSEFVVKLHVEITSFLKMLSTMISYNCVSRKFHYIRSKTIEIRQIFQHSIDTPWKVSLQ